MLIYAGRDKNRLEGAIDGTGCLITIQMNWHVYQENTVFYALGSMTRHDMTFFVCVSDLLIDSKIHYNCYLYIDLNTSLML